MRASWTRSLGLGLLGCALLGCHASKVDPRPPYIEEFGSPPADDPRYTDPPTYPAERNPLQPKKRVRKGSNFRMPPSALARGKRTPSRSIDFPRIYPTIAIGTTTIGGTATITTTISKRSVSS